MVGHSAGSVEPASLIRSKPRSPASVREGTEDAMTDLKSADYTDYMVRQSRNHNGVGGGGSFRIRTLRCGQEAIRHKRPPSHATHGPLPFIPFAS